MKATTRASLGVVAVAALGIALAVPAAAHNAVGKPTLSCDQVSVELEDFPHGPSTITFHIKVNGTQSTKTDQFAGPHGTASANISGLTTATGTLNIEAFASWTIEGGGQSETAKLQTVCHAPPNETSTERPPVLVGGVTAERPPAPAGGAVTATQESPAGSAGTGGGTPAAAPAVTAGPRFTG